MDLIDTFNAVGIHAKEKIGNEIGEAAELTMSIDRSGLELNCRTIYLLYVQKFLRLEEFLKNSVMRQGSDFQEWARVNIFRDYVESFLHNL